MTDRNLNMWAQIHNRGCGKVASYRVGKPLPSDPISHEHCHRVDGSPMVFAEPCVCGSCGADLSLVDMAPHNFLPVTDAEYQVLIHNAKVAVTNAMIENEVTEDEQRLPRIPLLPMPAGATLPVQGDAPRVTPERIDALMARVMYRYDNPEGTTSTFAHAYLDGEFFLVSGFSACVSKENFDAVKGRQYALKDAEPKVRAELWKLEGYALRMHLEALDNA